MIKYLRIIPAFFLFYSCGETQQDEPTDEGFEEVTLEEGEVAEDSVEVDTDISAEVFKDLEQIDDYAEFLMGAKIYDSFQDSPDPGASHWYSEKKVKNGFVSVTGAYEGAQSFALWRMENGNDLIGMTSMGCGPVCDYSFAFYEFSNSDSATVTNEIMPMDEILAHMYKIQDKVQAKYEVEYEDSAELLFQLPQKGTSMEVWISMDANTWEFPIVLLEWDKKSFSIAEKYNDIP